MIHEVTTQITPRFRLNEPVTIPEIGRPGIVTGIMFDVGGISFRVAYWNNGERKSEWLIGEEIQPLR